MHVLHSTTSIMYTSCQHMFLVLFILQVLPVTTQLVTHVCARVGCTATQLHALLLKHSADNERRKCIIMFQEFRDKTKNVFVLSRRVARSAWHAGTVRSYSTRNSQHSSREITLKGFYICFIRLTDHILECEFNHKFVGY